MTKGNTVKGKGQRKEELERKRDERNRRKVLKKEREITEYLEHDENFVSFKNQLEAIGMKIKDIIGDGNCLFRAFGDQLNGDHTAHGYHRRNTVQYMRKHREDFEPFMEDGITFDKHLQELSKLGSFGGNDSIVAFARNNGVDVVIHQLNNPRWVVHGSEYSKAPEIIEIHLAYHNGEHYSSVRSMSDPDKGPAWEYHRKKNATQPTVVEDKTTDTNNVMSKRQKKKELKKKNKVSQETTVGATPPIDNGLNGFEQTVVKETGCQDIKLITEVLQENNFDVDLTIGYVLQMMSIMEHENCDAQCTSSTEKKDDASSSPIENDTSTVNHEHLLKTQENISNETPDKEAGDLDDKKGEEALNEFVDNLRENLKDTAEKMNKQGARRKENTKKNNSQPATHLSNRQRKELAKQEKKKRRDERRKDEEKEKANSTLDALVGESKSIVPDLGVLRI